MSKVLFTNMTDEFVPHDFFETLLPLAKNDLLKGLVRSSMTNKMFWNCGTGDLLQTACPVGTRIEAFFPLTVVVAIDTRYEEHATYLNKVHVAYFDLGHRTGVHPRCLVSIL